MNKRTLEYVSDLDTMLGDGDRALRGYRGEPIDLDSEVARISDRVTSHVPREGGFIHSVHIYWSSNDILLLLAKIVQLQGEVERFKAAYTKLEKDFREELDWAIWEHEMGEDL